MQGLRSTTMPTQPNASERPPRPREKQPRDRDEHQRVLEQREQDRRVSKVANVRARIANIEAVEDVAYVARRQLDRVIDDDPEVLPVALDRGVLPECLVGRREMLLLEDVLCCRVEVEDLGLGTSTRARRTSRTSARSARPRAAASREPCHREGTETTRRTGDG